MDIKLTPSSPNGLEKMFWEQEVKPRHLSSEWLHMSELKHEELVKGRTVKVADNVRVAEVDYKATKLIRVTAELAGEKILDIMVSGDFCMIPKDALPKLESCLKGLTLNREVLIERLREFYEKNNVQTPGVVPEDFVEAIMKLNELA